MEDATILPDTLRNPCAAPLKIQTQTQNPKPLTLNSLYTLYTDQLPQSPNLLYMLYTFYTVLNSKLLPYHRSTIRTPSTLTALGSA